MKKILILRNAPHEGPGIIGSLLKERKIPVIIADRATELQPHLASAAALLVLGGPDSANDESEKMISGLQLVSRALADHLPFLGICLGMQMLVKASGGKVVRNRVKEIGFRGPDGIDNPIRLTPEGMSDPLLSGLPPEFSVFHLHGETVKIPSGFRNLAGGKHCAIQAVRKENAIGFQCHSELTEEMLIEWLAEDEDLRRSDADQIMADFHLRKPELENRGRLIFSRFLDSVTR